MSNTEPEAIDKLTKSRMEWRRLLTLEQYAVLFEEATEPSFSHPLDKEKRSGLFICAACFLPLFISDAKFDSGTGWPSFTQPIDGHINTKRDFKLVWPRTEYHCVRCGGHQGHVFNDGPPPTGAALVQQRISSSIRSYRRVSAYVADMNAPRE